MLAAAAPAGASVRPAPAATRPDPPAATTPAWCTDHGSQLVGWAGTFPNLPLCGPGPDYGGSWAYVVEPGPTGEVGRRYYNATPGFQCVELADRFLAVADGLAPVLAEGSQVAMNYHAAYPRQSVLVLNGSTQAVGHPPVAGDVISFSEVPDFQDPTDGHVAVVVSSRVDRLTGDGVVDIAQENVAETAMRRSLDLVSWRLVDPAEPPNAEWQYPYAEWLHITTPHVTLVSAASRAAIEREDAALAAMLRFGAAPTARRAVLPVATVPEAHLYRPTQVEARPAEAPPAGVPDGRGPGGWGPALPLAGGTLTAAGLASWASRRRRRAGPSTRQWALRSPSSSSSRPRW